VGAYSTIKQFFNINIDGTDSLPELDEVVYSTSLLSHKQQITLQAGASKQLSLTGLGTIKAFYIFLDLENPDADTVPEQLYYKLNGSSKQPLYSKVYFGGAPSSVEIFNDGGDTATFYTGVVFA
jgi:hypothetical protein